MNAFNIYFSVTLSGKTQTYKATELKINKEMYRISFSSTDGNSLFYTVTILSKEKVTFACVGEINYTFTLVEGKKSNFMLNLMGAPVDCEVYCSKLNVSIIDNKIAVSGKYKLNAGSNISNFSFVIGGTL